MRRIMLIAATIAVALAGPASAEERYRLEKSDGGYVRMDTQTGAMSICEERTGQLICRLAADERAAYDEELSGLQSRLDAVEARLGVLEKAPPGVTLMDEKTLEQSLGLMETFFRRFMGIVRDLDDKKGGAQLQRT